MVGADDGDDNDNDDDDDDDDNDGADEDDDDDDEDSVGERSGQCQGGRSELLRPVASGTSTC